MLNAVKRGNPSTDLSGGEERGKFCYRYPEGFVIASKYLCAAIRAGDIEGVTLKVFAYMLEHCNSSNKFDIAQSKIAADMGMRQPHVSRAMTELREKGFVLRYKDMTTGKAAWFVDARRAMRGSAEAHARVLERQKRERDRARVSNVRAFPARAAGAE